MIPTKNGSKLLALSACLFSSVMGATRFGNPSSAFIPGRYLVEFEDSTTVSLGISSLHFRTTRAF